MYLQIREYESLYPFFSLLFIKWSPVQRKAVLWADKKERCLRESNVMKNIQMCDFGNTRIFRSNNTYKIFTSKSDSITYCRNIQHISVQMQQNRKIEEKIKRAYESDKRKIYLRMMRGNHGKVLGIWLSFFTGELIAMLRKVYSFFIQKVTLFEISSPIFFQT